MTAEFRFDIPLLASRVIAAGDWATIYPPTATLPLGLFGASTGAAAALIAAAERPSIVRAVVSRGGRPDLAEAALDRVTAPTLLIVGGRDDVVLQLNRQALVRLRGAKQLVVVPNATHLFEEPGALNQVAQLATDWFVAHLV
jgi:pimeloyl-ACP methyl ester carboxylesterase